MMDESIMTVIIWILNDINGLTLLLYVFIGVNRYRYVTSKIEID
jgi:hypothetical protein